MVMAMMAMMMMMMIGNDDDDDLGDDDDDNDHGCRSIQSWSLSSVGSHVPQVVDSGADHQHHGQRVLQR